MSENAGTVTIIHRYFGKCTVKGCKTRFVLDCDRYGPAVKGPDAKSCTDHHISLDWRPMKATYNEDKECSDKCSAAQGPRCDCSCGGENHGIAGGRHG